MHREKTLVCRRKPKKERCNCLELCRIRNEKKEDDDEKSTESKKQLIIAKIFLRKLGELKKVLSKFLSTDLLRFFLYQAEKTKESWITIIFMSSRKIEDHLFYKEMKDVFGSRKEHLAKVSTEHLFAAMSSLEVCSIKKYEAIENTVHSLENNNTEDIKYSIFRGMCLILGRTQTVDILRGVQNKLRIKIAEKMARNCTDDVLSLVIATRIVVRAPHSWKKILRRNKQVFEGKKAAQFFLKDVLGEREVLLDSGEKEKVQKLSSLYDFFLFGTE